ncbi:hypothetical protein Tco_1202744 [Tanacetum coccineum]
MDESDLTMEEYIEFQAEKARRRGQTFNWETATYGKTSYQNVSSEPTVSIYNAIKANIDFSISFSDFEDEDYTVIYNKDSFSCKIIPVNDLKPGPVNEHVEINTESCLENIDIKPTESVTCINKEITPIEFNENLETNNDDKNKPSKTNMALPPRDQRHPSLRFEGFEYSDEAVHGFELRLERIFGRQIHRVQVLDFASLTEEMREDMDTRLRMVHYDERGKAPEKVTRTDQAVNLLYLLAYFLIRHTEGRKSEADMSRAHFIARLVDHFRLLKEERLQGLTMVVRLHICEELADTWVWVSSDIKRQQVAAAATQEAAEGAPDDDEGVQADPAPIQAPQPPLAAAWSMP